MTEIPENINKGQAHCFISGYPIIGPFNFQIVISGNSPLKAVVNECENYL